MIKERLRDKENQNYKGKLKDKKKLIDRDKLIGKNNLIDKNKLIDRDKLIGKGKLKDNVKYNVNDKEKIIHQVVHLVLMLKMAVILYQVIQFLKAVHSCQMVNHVHTLVHIVHKTK